MFQACAVIQVSSESYVGRVGFVKQIVWGLMKGCFEYAQGLGAHVSGCPMQARNLRSLPPASSLFKTASLSRPASRAVSCCYVWYVQTGQSQTLISWNISTPLVMWHSPNSEPLGAGTRKTCCSFTNKPPSSPEPSAGPETMGRLSSDMKGEF